MINFHYKNVTSFALAVLILAACQAPLPSPVYTEKEREFALKEYKECLVANIASIDDGKSDAYTIANAAATLCKEKYARFIEIKTADANPQVKAMVMRNTLSNQADMIVPMVLKMRAEN